jgi:rubrerythrin
MKDSTRIGMNKTGMQMHPMHSKELLESMEETPVDTQPDGKAIAELRTLYIEEADGIGSIPAPASAKGAAKSGAQILTGHRPQVFLDKLAERLAFERAGTRLYDALVTKFLARSEELRGASVEELMAIRNDEARHFLLIKECIESLGADPTAQTPSADVVGVQTAGLMQTVTDPRTSLAHSIHAALAAELVDNAGWETLILLARETGQDDMVERFTEALEQEADHLAKVSSWYESMITERSELGGRA